MCMYVHFLEIKYQSINQSDSVHNVCALNRTCIYIEKKLFKTPVAGIGIFRWGEMDNSMVADTLGPRSASSSVATMLTK